MSRSYTSDSIAAHALIVQARMFYAAIPFAIVFIVLAILGYERGAVAVAIVGALALGASAGAWVVASKFRD